MANTRPYPTAPFHSDSLDAKIAEGGHRYGKNQAAETLALVGGVDVDGIMAELKGEKGAAAAQEEVVPRRVELKGRRGVYVCAFCGAEFKYPRRKKYCSSACQNKQSMLNRFGWRKCKICGDQFLPRRENQMTCCSAHGQRWAIEQGKRIGRPRRLIIESEGDDA